MKYVVTKDQFIQGRHYFKGDAIYLTDSQAKYLLRSGRIKVATTKNQKKKKAVAPAAGSEPEEVTKSKRTASSKNDPENK